MHEALVDRIRRLRAAVAAHKAEIRRHREDLKAAAAALAEIEADCRRRGIELIIVSKPPIGVGVPVHGHQRAGTAGP